MNPAFLQENIQAWGGSSGLPLFVYEEECPSTNLTARQMGLAGAPSGSLAAAERQTAGRGRKGRAWESPEGANIAMSLVIRPERPFGDWPQLTLLGALAVARCLKALGAEPGIKWPNDLQLSGRKCCGILTESFPGREPFAVMGIGINVKRAAKTAEVAALSTSLEEEGFVTEREPLILAVRREMGLLLAQWERAGSLAPFKEEYEAFLLWKQERVRLTDAAGSIREGTLAGIREDGWLRILSPSGEEDCFGGELSLRQA